MLLNLQIVLCWFCEYLSLIPLWFTVSLRLEKFPSYSSPFFYRTLGHSRNFIYFFIIPVTCLFSQSQWKPVCNYIYIYPHTHTHTHTTKWILWFFYVWGIVSLSLSLSLAMSKLYLFLELENFCVFLASNTPPPLNLTKQTILLFIFLNSNWSRFLFRW